MWFRRNRQDSGIDRELQYHYDRLVLDHVARGLAESEARRLARLEFGGLAQIREDVRDARGHILADLAQDLRYAARTLRRSSAFLAVSVLSLALGVGANSALFTIINSLMLRRLPVPHSEQLIRPTRLNPSGAPGAVSYPFFELIHDHLSAASSVAVEMESNPEIVLDGVNENIPAELVSGDYFAMLGIQPALGRFLAPGDDVPSPTQLTAVISYDFWQRRFGGSPSVIGKTFTLEVLHRPVTVVGVTPARFRGIYLDQAPDLTLPCAPLNTSARWHDPAFNFLNVFARLKPNETQAHAEAQLQILWGGFRQQVAATMPASARAQFLKQPAAVAPAAQGISYLREDYGSPLLILMGIAALVLLLACANLSGMLLSRAVAREREISIRVAIGAGSARLMRQFLTESLLLAAAGGIAGLVLAGWFSRALLGTMAPDSSLAIAAGPDWRVLSFTAAISFAACVLAGLAPSLHAMRFKLNAGLKSRATHARLGKVLVGGQLAISMVLVVGSVLFTDTLVQLNRVDRGLRTSGVLTFRVRSSDGYASTRQWTSLGALEDTLNRMPGVASAAIAQTIPIGGGVWRRGVRIEGQGGPQGEPQTVSFNAIGAKYFATIGEPLVRGRAFAQRDDASAPQVAIVNEAFVRRYFPGQSSLGRRVTLNVPYEIVGVVRDARSLDLRHPPEPAMFVPWPQLSDANPINYSFVVRSSAGNPAALAQLIPSLVRQADPGFRLRAINTYDDLIGNTVITERIMAALGGFFGVLALLVACLGVFGVMAFQVSRRTNEIGIRIALGARREEILTLVLREAALLAAVGCAVGAVTALTLTGLAHDLLFGVTPSDPRVFAVSAIVLTLAALAAAWLPARRASRVDPLTALRQD
jgi:predicted permease